MSSVVAATTTSPRARAGAEFLGWLGPPVSLAKAAATRSMSRETVRRAAATLAGAITSNPNVQDNLHGLLELIMAAHDVGATVDATVERLEAQGLISDAQRFAAVVKTLRTAGSPLPLDLDRVGTPRWVEVSATGAVVAGLADGVPRRASGLSGDVEAAVSAGLARPVIASDRTGGTWVVARGDVRSLRAARALARMLTLTGPLPWVTILAAWDRGHGRPAWPALPTAVGVLDAWASSTPGLRLLPAGQHHAQLVDTDPGSQPVELDRTSEVLRRVLRPHPGGLARDQVVADAQRFGLRPASTAVALSSHPAVHQVQRTRWALLQSPLATTSAHLADAQHALGPRRARVAVTFAWSPEGQLVLRGPVPAAPSPVWSVPSAVAAIVEDRQFAIVGSEDHVVRVRGRKLWGFGPALGQLGLHAGSWLDLVLDPVNGTVRLRAPAQD